MKAKNAVVPPGNGATRPAVGGARPSQMMFTYGVGAQVDLPSMSVVVAGLDAWDKPREHVVIKRLLEAVQQRLGSQVAYLAALPWIPEVKGHGIDPSRFVGVPVLPFPRWMRCTACNLLSTCDGGHFVLKEDRYRPQRTRYVHATCLKNPKLKNPTVVPARFVLACERGHLDDFPWMEFVHGFAPCTKREKDGGLEMYDVGSGMRSTDVIVKCSRCETSAPMSSIYTRSESRKRMLPRCRGRHVHLRSYDPKGCPLTPSPMLLGASNMWFPETRTALALPSTESDLIERAVDEAWGYLASIPQRVVFDYVVTDKPELAPLRELRGDAVWAAIERRRVATSDDPSDVPTDLKRPEWERFIDPSGTAPSEEFDVRDRPVPEGYARVIASVTAATRLRSVVALVGFARIEAPDSGVAEDATPSRDQPPLAESGPYWVPAAEMRGEGLFIRLPEALVVAWSERAVRSERVMRILAGPTAAASGKTPRFLLLHSLSHLIINGVALDCGYSAASIRERIYSSDGSAGVEPMAGILLYTASPDAEGTLGGLVSLAEPERLGRILHQALRRATVCASDPMCADHIPSEHDPSRHGAACHACLFLPETSCECGNRYLDRSALEPTLAETAIAYFNAL